MVQLLTKSVRTLCLYSGIALLCLIGTLSVASSGQEKSTAEALAIFETKVRPLLSEQCFSCHGANTQRAGLRLDSRASLLKGGAHGPALVPSFPEKSLLLRAVHYEGSI